MERYARRKCRALENKARIQVLPQLKCKLQFEKDCCSSFSLEEHTFLYVSQWRGNQTLESEGSGLNPTLATYIFCMSLKSYSFPA